MGIGIRSSSRLHGRLREELRSVVGIDIFAENVGARSPGMAPAMFTSRAWTDAGGKRGPRGGGSGDSPHVRFPWG